MAKKAAKRNAARSTRKRSTKRQKQTSLTRGATKRRGSRASAQKRANPKRRVKTARKAAGKTAGRRKAAARKTAVPRKQQKRPARKAAAPRAKSRAASAARKPARKKTARREGGTGRERDLAQTPETGRSVKGLTNPYPTKRSTGTAAGAGGTRQAPGLERARRRLREVEESIQGPPSSLDLDRRPSAARSGRHELFETRLEHTEVSPEITAGDVDADWEDAYANGDEAPGGDNPTPDQDRVDDIGKALGVEYEDNEELKASDKIAERDRKRWELDPASSDDYPERD